MITCICPNQNGAGDSPIDHPGSGEPHPNLTTCTMLALVADHNYSHGTYIAGVAAGRQTSLIIPSNLQGVGTDAPEAGAFNTDIMAALEILDDSITPSTTGNPFVANLSIGTNPHSSGTCPTTINTIAGNLISKGVPVVAATGTTVIKNKLVDLLVLQM